MIRCEICNSKNYDFLMIENKCPDCAFVNEECEDNVKECEDDPDCECDDSQVESIKEYYSKFMDDLYKKKVQQLVDASKYEEGSARKLNKRASRKIVG